MKLKNLFILLIALLSFSCAQQQQSTITDLIKPVNLKEGVTTRLVLSDLFYADNYNVDFLSNTNFSVRVDKKENIVEITPHKNFTGLDLISFNLFNKTFELPVKLGLKKKYLFSYKPKGNPGVVNLFGQFNGWNKENLPMNDEDGDGDYEITIPLDPGRYEW